MDTDSSRTIIADSESEEESQKEGDKSSSPTVSTDGSGSSSDDDSSSSEPELDPSMCLLSCVALLIRQWYTIVQQYVHFVYLFNISSNFLQVLR